MITKNSKVILFANTDWYLYNFRRSLAAALRDAGYDVLLISPPGEYGPRLEALGFRWQALPMDRRSLNPLREASLILHLYSLFKTEKPAIVHNFTIKCAIYGSLASKAARVAAQVNAVAGMGYIFASRDAKATLLRPLVKTLLKLSLGGKYSRLILQNPDDVSEFIESRLLGSDKIVLIKGSGVDLNRYTHDENFSTDTFTVLLASRLLWDKGIQEYVESARQLKSAGRNIRFLLAGSPDEGNPASVDSDIISAWVKEGLIEWLGHVDDMASLLKSIDVFVLPSSYREGTPRSLIEAAGCARALITTDTPGCREVVTDNVDGLLVPVKDATALANAIARLQDNPELAQRLGKAAQQKALTEFDEKIVIANTLAVYRELLPGF